MHGKKRMVSLVISMGVLLLALSFTSCFPGRGVYEGPLKETTSAVLAEGKEYLVYFESPCSGIGGGSTSRSAQGYPTLGRIVAIYHKMGSTIRNTITSGKLSAYWSETSSGITVARFRLEGGEGTRSITLHVDMDAYREFATSYNKRRSPGGFVPGGGIDPRAPSQPNKLVIREAGSFSFSPGPVWLVGFIVFIAYLIYRQQGTRKKI